MVASDSPIGCLFYTSWRRFALPPGVWWMEARSEAQKGGVTAAPPDQHWRVDREIDHRGRFVGTWTSVDEQIDTGADPLHDELRVVERIGIPRKNQRRGQHRRPKLVDERDRDRMIRNPHADRGAARVLNAAGNVARGG